MIKEIISFSLQRRLLVNISAVIIVLWGLHSMFKTPVDAVPDLSDLQVVIFTEFPGQAPQIVEDQITYPMTTTMLSVPFAKLVRGYSTFGLSFVFIIFEDGTDIYWARSRVLEYINTVGPLLPKGVTPVMGPDATGVGWVYQYALVDKTGKHDLSELRSIQDWYLRYELQTVPGVSEVASLGGYIKQYQVEVDPNKLVAYGISLHKIIHAIKRSNDDVGGRLLEVSETEYMVRGLGYIQDIEDMYRIPLGANKNGTPTYLKDVASIKLGPDLRRGIAELNGEGEVVGGIVVMRYKENAMNVINAVKKKLEDLKKGLPEGVEVLPVYDRSHLIQSSIDNLREKLIEECVIVSLVCLIFLMHLRSALVAILVLPVGILMAFIVITYQGLNANIMSLGGIAIAIGAMIDAAIVMIENAHKHIERNNGEKGHWQVIYESAVEVGPALFFSLSIMTVSFLSIFSLQAQEGRLFSPLAFTKTYAMAASALLSITMIPVMMGYFVRGKIIPEHKNPINKILIWIYNPIIWIVLRMKSLTLLAAVLILILTLIPVKKIGSEFMPPLNEGDLLYMPSSIPGISITKAKEILQQTDKILMEFPEVERVFGKIGRADTVTDPAPLSMVETTILLKPKEKWRQGMTMKTLTQEMDDALQVPGLTNAWTMPIKNRIDMLATGIKTPVGIKVFGDDLKVLQELGTRIEEVMKTVPGTASVYAERVVEGNYLDFEIDREEAARFGLTTGDVQDVIKTAVGGMNISSTVENRERYPINLRYSRELRDDIDKLNRILISTPSGRQVPIAHVAKLKFKKGPGVIKSENARLSAWIYVDIADIDIGTYVKNAQKIVGKQVKLPSGYSIKWSGQFEYMERARERMKLVIPFTLITIFLLLYLNFKDVTESLIVMLSLPFALVGGVWLVYFLQYEFSVAVVVGFIALAGVAAETGVIMLIYMDQAYKKRIKEGTMNTLHDVRDAIIEGAVQRVRPKIMTVTAIIAGLIPIMWGHGTGSEVMKRIAAPMVGGMFSATILTLIVIPALYAFILERRLKYSKSFRQ